LRFFAKSSDECLHVNILLSIKSAFVDGIGGIKMDVKTVAEIVRLVGSQGHLSIT